MEDNTAESQLDKVTKILDEYENKLGLPTVEINQEKLNEYMNMSREVMERLEPSQCREISSQLISAAYHFQKMKNREDTKVIWATALMTKLATGRISQYNIGSFNQNFDAAVLDNSFTLKLFDIKRWASQISKRLEYLPNMLRDKADSFKELAKNKEQKYG